MTAAERHALLYADDQGLLARCDVDRYRASGPGGQHRNKTESAVRLRLRGVTPPVLAIAEESRSQHENKASALRRMRGAIACELRCEHLAASPQLLNFVKAGTGPLGAKTRHTAVYWASMAELLDAFVAHAAVVSTCAASLGCSTGALSKLLLHDDVVARAANGYRQALGLRPLV